MTKDPWDDPGWKRAAAEYHATSAMEALSRANGHDQDVAPHIELATLVDVVPESIEWLWPGRIARRKLTLIAGEPGLGKSQLGVDIIAHLTTGSAWPDTGCAPLGDAIILSAEDAINDTVRPRAEAASADLERVHMVRSVLRPGAENQINEAMFSLLTDLDALGSAITGFGGRVSLVMVDPITAYLGDKIDTHKTAAVRSVLALLDQFAEKYNVAVAGISHPPKVVAGAKAINAITGSLAFVAAARIALLVVEDSDNEGRILLLPVKNNLGRKASGLAYRMAQTIITNDIIASYLVWDPGEVAITANEALANAAESAKDHNALRDAKAFLVDWLANGPLPAKEIEEAAKAESISERTLRRARKDLGIIAGKQEFTGPWQWRLPDKAG